MNDVDSDPLLCVSDWQYRAEGNASVVIFNPKTRTILKLRKAPSEKLSQWVGTDDWSPFQEYIQTVISPLLGPDYVCLFFAPSSSSSSPSPQSSLFVNRPKIITVTKDFLSLVSERLKAKRPEKRLHLDIDTSKLQSLSLPDFTLLQYPKNLLSDAPTFCVEIKPKRGFLPISHHIPDDLAVKASVCRHCIHQQYKVKRGIWDKPSCYCPLDLFSCDPHRMKYSLNMLLENPQNNLRIFKNGIAIYQVEESSQPPLANQQSLAEHLRPYFGSRPEEVLEKRPLESCFVQSFLDVVIQALLSQQSQNGTKLAVNGTCTRLWQGRNVCASSSYTSCSKDKFPPEVKLDKSDHCVLRRLLAAQSLSHLEIDDVLPLYKKVVQHLEKYPQDREKYRLDFPYEINYSKIDEEATTQNGRKADMSSVSLEDAVRMIREYLITRTLKDCSIMLTMQPTTRDTSSPPLCEVPCLETPSGRNYVYSVTIIDLDPKPSSRIPMYESIDREAALEYTACLQNGHL